MWNIIMDRLPSGLGTFCIFLSFFIPYFINRFNRKLHKDLDPPWKQESENQHHS